MNRGVLQVHVACVEAQVPFCLAKEALGAIQAKGTRKVLFSLVSKTSPVRSYSR